MSITNVEVIDDALKSLNVISEVATASSEQGKYVLTKLNQMMEMWREDGISIGFFPQSVTTDTCPIPDYAELAVISSLSVVIAPKYGATLSQELVAVIDRSYTALLRKSLYEKLDNTDMSHLPIGQGHFGTRYDITTDN